MSLSQHPGVYHTPEWIQWCVDTKQVIVIDRSLGKPYILRGLEAAIWNWFTLGYTCSRVAELAAASQNQSLPGSEQRVGSMVSDWITNGILVEK